MKAAAEDCWWLLNSGPGESALNMALDHALLDAVQDLGRPVLRFYGWREPAATFGYFQDYAEVARLTPLRPLIRRPTGGGLVPHAADWTYSVAVPPGHSWYGLRAAESYCQLHLWLRDAFDLLHLSTHLAPERNPAAPGQCFAGAEQFDLLEGVRKIAGAAQRRNRQGLLIQGSVQPLLHAVTNRPAWEAAMCRCAERSRAVIWAPLPEELLADRLRPRAEILARQRYGCESYNRKRLSPAGEAAGNQSSGWSVRW